VGAVSRLVKGVRIDAEFLRHHFGTDPLESRTHNTTESIGKERDAVEESLDLHRAESPRDRVEIGFDDFTDLFPETGESILPPGARPPVIAELIAGDAKEPRDEGRRIAGSDFRVGDEKNLLSEVVRIVLVCETRGKISAHEQAILPNDETELIRLTPIHGGEHSLELKGRFIPHTRGSSPENGSLTGITVDRVA
jgi:hypothetical protein